MTVRHMDNFSIYGGVAGYMLDGIYAENALVTLVNDPDGVSGGKVVRFGVGGTSTYRGFRYVLPVVVTKVGIAARIWLPTLPTGADGSVAIMQWRDGGNSNSATLTLESTGRLAFRGGGATGASVGATVSPVIAASGWYHVEGLYDTAAGTFTLQVEGIEVLAITGLSPGIVNLAQIFCGILTDGTGAGHSYNMKDLVVYDGLGASNNSFIGTVLVASLTPTSDAALNWTPSIGATGYEILDNNPPNDAQYITAIDPPPAAYKAELSNLPADVTSVKAVMTVVRAAKTDGGDGNLQIGVISDVAGTPSTALGADRPINTTQNYWRDVFEVDPDTAAAWTPSAVDAMQIQINRTL